jgi:hypothetical protein
VRTLHQASGTIHNPLGCRCDICCAHLDAEAVALEHAGQNPHDGRDVLLDMLEMWQDGTRKRLEMDAKLRAYTRTMLENSYQQAGAAASHAMRTDYAHFLSPPAQVGALLTFSSGPLR